MHHRSLDWKAEIARFRLNSGHFSPSDPEDVGCGYDYLRRAGLSGGGTVVTKRAIIQQTTLLTSPRGGSEGVDGRMD